MRELANLGKGQVENCRRKEWRKC